jgi:hypothetical protein
VAHIVLQIGLQESHIDKKEYILQTNNIKSWIRNVKVQPLLVLYQVIHKDQILLEVMGINLQDNKSTLIEYCLSIIKLQMRDKDLNQVPKGKSLLKV